MNRTLGSLGAAALLLGALGGGVAWADPDFKGVQAPVRPEPAGPVVNPQDDPPPRQVYAPARPHVPAEP
jgi:hypothetical protein